MLSPAGSPPAVEGRKYDCGSLLLKAKGVSPESGVGMTRSGIQGCQPPRMPRKDANGGNVEKEQGSPPTGEGGERATAVVLRNTDGFKGDLCPKDAKDANNIATVGIVGKGVWRQWFKCDFSSNSAKDAK